MINCRSGTLTNVVPPGCIRRVLEPSPELLRFTDATSNDGVWAAGAGPVVTARRAAPTIAAILVNTPVVMAAPARIEVAVPGPLDVSMWSLVGRDSPVSARDLLRMQARSNGRLAFPKAHRRRPAGEQSASWRQAPDA